MPAYERALVRGQETLRYARDMGIGRRQFLATIGAAIASIAVSDRSAALTHGSLYLNRRLGVAFNRPDGWHFNSLGDIGRVAKDQVLELDGDAVEALLEDAQQFLAVSLSEEPVSVPHFTCAANVHLERITPDDADALANAIEELGLLPKLMPELRTIEAPRARTISNCDAAEYVAEFLFDHPDLSEPVTARLRSLLVVQDRWRHTFRMYDAPSLGERRTFDFSEFIASIRIL